MDLLTCQYNQCYQVCIELQLLIRFIFFTNIFNVVYRLDGLELGVVDIGDTEKPRSISIHSMKRLLFWTDAGGQQSIYRARIDGADRLTLASKLDGIAAIAVDQQLDLLFFAYNKRIDVMDLDGRNKYVPNPLHSSFPV